MQQQNPYAGHTIRGHVFFNPIRMGYLIKKAGVSLSKSVSLMGEGLPQACVSDQRDSRFQKSWSAVHDEREQFAGLFKTDLS